MIIFKKYFAKFFKIKESVSQSSRNSNHLQKVKVGRILKFWGFPMVVNSHQKILHFFHKPWNSTLVHNIIHTRTKQCCKKIESNDYWNNLMDASSWKGPNSLRCTKKSISSRNQSLPNWYFRSWIWGTIEPWRLYLSS